MSCLEKVRTGPYRYRLNPECLVGDHHFVNVVAFGALKGAEVEARACGHDAGEHHVSLALCTSRAMDLNVDVVGQRTRFWHDASLEEAGARRSLSPVCAWKAAVMEPALIIEFRLRWSILIGSRRITERAERAVVTVTGIFDKLA
jgi:hypothetical protein